MAMELSGPRPIVMEPAFVESFCRTEPSNLTISKVIFVHLSNEIRATPGDELRKPAFRLTDDDHGNVILTAVFIRPVDQPLRGNPNSGRLRQNPCNLVFRHHSCQAVRAKQECVARE